MKEERPEKDVSSDFYTQYIWLFKACTISHSILDKGIRASDSLLDLSEIVTSWAWTYWGNPRGLVFHSSLSCVLSLMYCLDYSQLAIGVTTGRMHMPELVHTTYFLLGLLQKFISPASIKLFRRFQWLCVPLSVLFPSMYSW